MSLPPNQPDFDPSTISDAPPPEEVVSPDDDDDGEPIHWVPVANFTTSGEAHIARLKLEAEEIDCYLDNENIVATDWLYANATGGIKVMVSAQDYERAWVLLAAVPVKPTMSSESMPAAKPISLPPTKPGLPPPMPATKVAILICPQCKSSRIHRVKMKRKLGWFGIMLLIANPLVWLGIAIFLPSIIRAWRNRNWECDDCGHEWKPDDPTGGFPVVVKLPNPPKSS